MTDEAINNTGAHSAVNHRAAGSGAELALQLEVRARKVLERIEKRCLYQRAGARQANRAYFDPQPGGATGEDRGFYWQPSEETLTIKDLNRCTSGWKDLLPSDVGTRAALIRLVEQRYDLRRTAQRRMQVALGIDDPEVQAAFEMLYAQPLDSIFRSPVDTQPAADIHPDEAREVVFNAVSREWDLYESDDELEWITLPSGAVLYRQGDAADGLYIIISGRLHASVEQDDATRLLVEIGRGEMIGEMETLTGEKRATTVMATRDSELIRISQADLDTLAERRPQLMRRLVHRMANRMLSHISTTPQDGASVVAFAVLRAGPAHAESRPALSGNGLKEFLRRMAESLGSYGPTLLLNSEQLDRQVGAGWAQTPENGENNGWLAAYLSEQEAHYRYVIYEADAGPSEWTRRCLRQADRVLIVADSRADPEPGEVEALLAQQPAPVHAELVLVHPEGTLRPEATRRWLTPRRVQGHHHVRATHAEDLNRLVRRLTGRALGLVLSGGGARGYAHLGVIRALKRAGLHIDVVGGASMGSIIGAVFALDMDEAEVMHTVRRLSSPFKLFDLTLPLVSFFKSEKVTRALQEIFGAAQIEDLWRPYFCVSSNLTRAITNLHVQGPLWEAVRASSAIPGVFSPVLSGDELLVDGAVLNNFPVDLMKDFAGGGPIIGVNVFPEVDLVRKYDFGHSVSGWEVLLRKLNPFGADVSAPLIFENILRVIALNDVHQAKAKAQLCDLYITPQVSQYGILEFQSYDKIIEAGYRTAMQAIEQWSAGAEVGLIATKATAPVVSQLEQSLADLDQALHRLTPQAAALAV